MAGSSNNSESFQLEEGDILVACTDGIIEAESSVGEEWGQQRLENLFSSCGWQTPQDALQRIITEVSAFGSDKVQKDDMTLVMQVTKIQ